MCIVQVTSLAGLSYGKVSLSKPNAEAVAARITCDSQSSCMQIIWCI